MQARPTVYLVGGLAAIAALMIVVFATGSDNGSDVANPTASTGPPGDNGPGAATGATRTPVPREGPHAEAVVSAHELATQAGIATLQRGGTAADAAVAVAATLSVVEPWFSSVLGGGTWALYYEASTGRVTSMDGVGPTGSNATVEDFAQRAGDGGIHQSNVPGAWDGWMLWLEAYGVLELDEVLEPAITIAREGYRISAEMADWLEQSAISARPETAAIYAPDGLLLGEGDIVHQHDLADTFEALIAAYESERHEGRSAALQAARDYYYRGPLAEAIVSFSDENGGYLTIEDFRGFEAAIVEPIMIEWNDEITVYQNPPNSQGITMLIALNILKGFDLSGLESQDGEALHLQVEALKLAFADRHHHVGDPDRIDVPVEGLLSEAHAAAQRALIVSDSALSWPIEDAASFDATLEEEIGDTTTFHVVDREGNAAAVTTSLGAQFLVAGDTGIHMNNRMRFLALEDGDPNQLTPGYKVRHTSNPYMVLRNGVPYILGGNTGVDTQAQGQLQQFINIVEFGFAAQEAVDAPRFVVNSFPATTYPYEAPNTLNIESGLSEALIAELEARGHDIQQGGLFGTAAVLIISEDGLVVEAGVDGRTSTSAATVIPAGE